MKKLLLIAPLLLTGCGTMISIADGEDRRTNYVYSGVKSNLNFISICSSVKSTGGPGNMGCILTPIMYLDLPFSFALDTVLLPVQGTRLIIEKVESK